MQLRRIDPAEPHPDARTIALAAVATELAHELVGAAYTKIVAVDHALNIARKRARSHTHHDNKDYTDCQSYPQLSSHISLP